MYFELWGYDISFCLWGLNVLLYNVRVGYVVFVVFGEINIEEGDNICFRVFVLCY